MQKTERYPSPIRIPPQSLETEKALLGSIMLRPESMHDVLDHIISESFYAEKHRIIFDAIFELFERHDPVDLLTVATTLRDKKLLDKIGGNAYLTELVNMVPSSANVNYYAQIVHKKNILRQLIEASDDISEQCYGEPDNVDELLDESEKRIFSVSNMTAAQKFVNIKDVLGDAFERIDKLNNSENELRGVPTGFAALDSMLAGLQRSDLIILAARPSMGKTSLALDIARQAATKHNAAVGVFSLEMSSQQLVDRMLAAEARVDSWKLRTGKISSDEEFSQLSQALDRLSRSPIYIDDQPGNNILKMRSTARQLKRKQGLDLLIVDYLQLMIPTKHSDSVVQQVTELSRSLKSLARELDVPVLALSQLNRAVEHRGGRPRLSDLRDSGSIEQDADVVMFIHREDKYNKESDRQNIAEIMIEKHRNGPTGLVELYFDDKKTTFLEIDKNTMPAPASSDNEFNNF